MTSTDPRRAASALQIYQHRRVLVTGHTGFKGGWLTIWLRRLGAQVTGLSLAPPADRPCLFQCADVARGTDSIIGDIRDATKVAKVFADHQPECVFHLAAQPLVRASYANPLGTFATNVLGTANLLESARRQEGVLAVVNVTTDKCYANNEWDWGYRETDRLGGIDPYSASKACSELVTASYRDAFLTEAGRGVATARAGNVIGGGDWSEDRLIPDIVRSVASGQDVVLRHPASRRPWQHVLDPLWGYLLLGARLLQSPSDPTFTDAFNFGPDASANWPVERVTSRIIELWGDGRYRVESSTEHPHEAGQLHLDASRARRRLGWQPNLPIDDALAWTVDWYRAWSAGDDLRDLTESQIDEYLTRSVGP